MDFAPLRLDFLAPCDDRTTHKVPGNDKVQYHVCQSISKVTGHEFGVDPRTCAQCMLRGTPDQAFLDRIAHKQLGKQMQLAQLGFYKNEEDILHLVRTIWPYMKETKTLRNSLGEAITNLVGLGRISLEKAEALVSTELKELLDDGDFGEIKASGGRSTGRAAAGVGLKAPTAVAGVSCTKKD